jgi:hypothetical protein
LLLLLTHFSSQGINLFSSICVSSFTLFSQIVLLFYFVFFSEEVFLILAKKHLPFGTTLILFHFIYISEIDLEKNPGSDVSIFFTSFDKIIQTKFDLQRFGLLFLTP